MLATSLMLWIVLWSTEFSPHLPPLVTIANWLLLLRGVLFSQEGTTQWDPLSMLLFPAIDHMATKWKDLWHANDACVGGDLTHLRHQWDVDLACCETCLSCYCKKAVCWTWSEHLCWGTALLRCYETQSWPGLLRVNLMLLIVPLLMDSVVEGASIPAVPESFQSFRKCDLLYIPLCHCWWRNSLQSTLYLLNEEGRGQSLLAKWLLIFCFSFSLRLWVLDTIRIICLAKKWIKFLKFVFQGSLFYSTVSFTIYGASLSQPLHLSVDLATTKGASSWLFSQAWFCTQVCFSWCVSTRVWLAFESCRPLRIGPYIFSSLKMIACVHIFLAKQCMQRQSFLALLIHCMKCFQWPQQISLFKELTTY